MEDKTTLKGAVIASTTGDLTIDTGSLEYSHIKDRNSSTNFGGGVNVGSDSKSVNAKYGFTDKRQTNFATIGEGTITVRDENADLSKLNRDVSKAQYGTMELGVQLSADKSTIDLLTNPEDTYNKTMEGFGQIADRGKKIEEQTHIVEKTGNAIEYGHFTTDDKVKSYLSMDEYEKRVEDGKPVSAQDKLNYYGSKNFVGESLTPEERLDLNQAVQVRKIEVANDLKQNILDTWKDSTAPIVNAKLEALRKLDPAAAAEIDVKFAGVNASERQRAVIVENSNSVLANANDGFIYEKSPEKSGGFRETLERWGQGLGSWGTEKNREITNSSVVQSGHQYGEYLNANPDVALATCFGAAAIGTGAPIIVSEAAASGLITPITQAVVGKNTSDQIINGTVAFINTIIYWQTDNNPTIGGAAVTFGESYLLSGVNSYISGLNILNTTGKVVATGVSNAIIDYGVQYSQVQIGQKNSVDMNQVIFSGVGGSTGAALTRVLPETTGKVINDLPTIWTQISTSEVNAAIPVMLSK